MHSRRRAAKAMNPPRLKSSSFAKKCSVCGENCGKLTAVDLFCGAGGSGCGIRKVGFCVLGVDIQFQPRYAGCRFVQADALTFDLSSYDFAWASPPCQRYTRAQNAAKNADAHPDLIDTVREKLEAWGGPWIMENVVGAPMRNPTTVCGLALGLKVKRHRLFESNLFLMCPPCPSHDQDYYVIFGHEVRNRRHGQAAGRKNKIKEGRAAMGIDWMTRGELSEAIPPAYAEFLMRQVVRIIQKPTNAPGP